MLNTALNWYSQGIATIPLLYRSKKPIIKWGQYKTTLPAIEDVVQWFTGPRRNLGLITTEHLIVIDFDSPMVYADWYYWQMSQDPSLTDTYMVSSSRGIHLYYWVAKDFEPIKTLEPYEIKSHGKLINIPPSVHSSGIPYRAINNPNKIKKVSNIEQLLTFSSVKFELPKRYFAPDPWRIVEPIATVDLLELFPNAKPTDDTGRYFITDCPFHGHHNNFWFDTRLKIAGCYAGCGNFLASELIK